MTDSSLPAGLIEAVARRAKDWVHGGRCNAYCPDERSHHLRAHEMTIDLLGEAFSWRDDKPCETCHGKMFVKRKGWYCGCGAGIKHMRDCGRPAPHDKCPDCISGRVEGDRRVILTRQGELDYLREQVDLLQDDLIRFMEQRALALEEAALEIQTGPDGQDYLDRSQMIVRWVEAAWERYDGGERAHQLTCPPPNESGRFVFVATPVQEET